MNNSHILFFTWYRSGLNFFLSRTFLGFFFNYISGLFFTFFFFTFVLNITMYTNLVSRICLFFLSSQHTWQSSIVPVQSPHIIIYQDNYAFSMSVIFDETSYPLCSQLMETRISVRNKAWYLVDKALKSTRGDPAFST